MRRTHRPTNRQTDRPTERISTIHTNMRGGDRCKVVSNFVLTVMLILLANCLLLLIRHITCHRAQGQTLAGTVSVDLALDNPDARLPSDISSIIYVAITRVRRLEDLFVSPIFPTFWKKMAESPDVDRRKSEADLQKASAALAMKHGRYLEMRAELDWKPRYGDVEKEWKELQMRTTEPVSTRNDAVAVTANSDLYTVRDDGARVPMCRKAALSERHIGIDQGRRNFAIAVVDRIVGERPQLDLAKVYNLELPKKFTAADALTRLMSTTDLMLVMQQQEQPAGGPIPHVDRVVVHLEQMSTKNPNWKQLGPELGKLLQRSVADVETCVVKMSQPNVHRANGPLFKMGTRIVEELKLEPATYGKKRRAAKNPPKTGSSKSYLLFFSLKTSVFTFSFSFHSVSFYAVIYRRYIIISTIYIIVETGGHWRLLIVCLKARFNFFY